MTALPTLATLPALPEGDPDSVLALGHLDGQPADVDGAQHAAGTITLVTLAALVAALVTLVRGSASSEDGTDEAAEVLVLATTEQVGIEPDADC